MRGFLQSNSRIFRVPTAIGADVEIAGVLNLAKPAANTCLLAAAGNKLLAAWTIVVQLEP